MGTLSSNSFIRSAAVASLLFSIGLNTPALANPAQTDDLNRRIQALEAQLQALKEQIARQQAEQAEHQTAQQEQLEIIADEQAEQSSKLSWAERTKIGGYGEMHYNNLDGSGGASDLDRIDFHRFVLFFGHEFNERMRFFSELELEHALTADGAPGEVELEQAYIEYDINDRLTGRAGLFLIPVGILNETHEPPTFYGVERNPVEAAIIPTTWWAGGAGLTWRLADGWTYDAAIHEGLNVTNANFAVRSGRQKTANADASDLAFTGRLKWTGMPGLELAGTYQYQSDITQSSSDNADDAQLFEAHAVFTRGPFGLRALYAMWDIKGNAVSAAGADRQEGYYIEPSWKITPSVGVFTRYNFWDNQAGDGSIASEKEQWDVGLNWWPHENVVFKADYQMQDNENGQDRDGFNLGVGYQF